VRVGGCQTPTKTPGTLKSSWRKRGAPDVGDGVRHVDSSHFDPFQTLHCLLISLISSKSFDNCFSIVFFIFLHIMNQLRTSPSLRVVKNKQHPHNAHSTPCVFYMNLHMSVQYFIHLCDTVNKCPLSKCHELH
jgi:hypothetical protein